ncbi:glycosyltransferase [Streptomyces sp. NPDC092296]|uniref:glycosyltransferase n=1 Tax=Streptomyces sp. NPDC092296 TaxID=3366012 RepID=UPI0037FE9273
MTDNTAADEPQGFADLGKILVIIPTYNEVENVTLITARVRAAVPEAHILVADDNSPDGTGEVADELAAADANLHVLHRKGKEGLGAAYLAGFRWGIDNGYDVLVEMDADGSHQPEQLPRLLTGLRGGADLVLGSRWVPGGSAVNWPKHREFISRGGSTYSRLMLGVPLRDVTGGYRAFRRETLLGLGMDEVASQGYCFQVDLAWRAVRAGFRVVEVPITFVERELGASKMSRTIVVEALMRVTSWGVQNRLGRLPLPNQTAGDDQTVPESRTAPDDQAAPDDRTAPDDQAIPDSQAVPDSQPARNTSATSDVEPNTGANGAAR